MVATVPAKMVTFAVDSFGKIAWKANPALYMVGFAVVQPARTTAIIPKIPIALFAKGPGATGGASPLLRNACASGDFK